jgi:hypothetical protein
MIIFFTTTILKYGGFGMDKFRVILGSNPYLL